MSDQPALVRAGQLANRKYSADFVFLSLLAKNALNMPLRDLVRQFASYTGFLFFEPARIIRDAMCSATGGDAFDDNADNVSAYGRVRDDLLRDLGLADLSYFSEAKEIPPPIERLLETCHNVHQSGDLPAGVTHHLKLPECPSLDLYRINEATLFTGPCGFQLLRRDDDCFIPTATSRPLVRSILSLPIITINRPIVLIQDIFNGYNFAHFLFDWMTRLALFAERGPARHRDCIYVFGGLPNEFHEIILDAVQSLLGIGPDNLLFPTSDALIQSTREIYYFSDQRHVSGHPAQMCRPEAMEWMQRLTVAIGAKAGRRKLYISRGDAGSRAIANEAELFRVLAPLGFEYVRLSELRIADQLALTAAADAIVGAHGMGLTYLGIHPGRDVRVVELFNPGRGTDAYAFVSKGKGFGYRHVAGVEREGDAGDFDIDPGEVLRALGHDGSRSVGRSASAPAMIAVPGTWRTGVQPTPAAMTEEVPPPDPGVAVLKHIRDPQVRDMNVSWLEVSQFEALKLHTFTCWVYIPRSFGGNAVWLTFPEPNGRTVNADLSLRDQWQFLSVPVMSPGIGDALVAVLRVNSDVGATVYSAGWQVGTSGVAASEPLGLGGNEDDGSADVDVVPPPSPTRDPELAASVSSSSASTSAASLVEQARRAEAAADWRGAQLGWNEARRRFPEMIVAYSGEVAALCQQQRLDEAQILLYSAMTLFGDEYDLLVEHGKLALARKDWSDVVQRFRYARMRYPERWQCYAGEASGLIELGRRDEASALLRDAASRFPEQAFQDIKRRLTEAGHTAPAGTVHHEGL